MTSDSESHDRATIRALTEIDPGLGDLFVQGRRLCKQRESPGLVYLLAHVGRELTDCLIRELTGDGRSAELVDEAEQSFRGKIGDALGVSPNHESVRRWFRVHQKFHGSAHARVPAPPIAPLRPAFNELAGLLYGRVGPYFETQADIDALALNPSPAGVPSDQIRALLLRPVQRRRFFGRIDRVDWLKPLEDAGLFRHPPGRITYEDRSWRAQQWPEGAFLLRMVPHAPEHVSRIIQSVPDSNDNPIVWNTVADVVVALPPGQSAPLARKLARALRLDFAHQLAHHAITAAKALALKADNVAFELADALLWSANDLPLPPAPDSTDADAKGRYLESLRDTRRQLFWSDKWSLPRLDDYEVDRVVDELLPALDALDSKRTFELLLSRLNRLTTLVARNIQRFSRAVEQTQASLPVEEILDEADEGDIDSGRWCPELDHDDHDSSVRRKIAVATFSRAVALSAPNADAAVDIIERLEVTDSELIRRMILGLLARASDLNAGLRDRLDAFVASTDALEPTFGATEVAALLRAHFEDASEAAQDAFTAALARGPDAEDIDRIADNARFMEADLERNEIVREWQSRRLRWFHEKIPAKLQSLAIRLGVSPGTPSHWEQALDEGRPSGRGGVFSGRHHSPMSADQLGALSPPDFVRYLAEWRPHEQSHDPFETPSVEGLRTDVAALAAQRPAHIATLLPAIVDGNVDLPLHYMIAILNGLRSAFQQKQSVEPLVVLELAMVALQRAETALTATKRERQVVDWLLGAACDLVIEYLERTTPNAADRELAWMVLDTFTESSVVWSADGDDELPSTWSGATSASRSKVGARVVEALYQLAWCDFLEEHAGRRWPPPKSTRAGDRLAPFLDSILARDGISAMAAQGVIGEHLNQLVWIARDWTLARLPVLLDGGTEDPGRHPAWTAYIEGAGLHPLFFPELRPWYTQHAAKLPTDGQRPSWDPEWTHADPFTQHVTWASLRGLCRADDALVINTFSRVPVKDRTHAYWSIWRAFESQKRKQDVHREILRNVVPFWEARLDVLERMPAGQLRDEEVDGLSQLIATRHLPPKDAIRLGQRTTALLRRKQRVTGTAWQHLGHLAKHDARGTFVIAERLIETQLADEFPYVAFDDVAPALRTVLATRGKTRERALSLLNRIGEKVQSDEFGELWREAQQKSPRPSRLPLGMRARLR